MSCDMFGVLVSGTFQKQFRELPDDVRGRIHTALSHLEEDPFGKRSGADIKPLSDTDPRNTGYASEITG